MARETVRHDTYGRRMGRLTSNALGKLGEGIAVAFLERHGVRVVRRNVFVDRDEIDIIYLGDEGLVAVEVKTVSDGADPFNSLTDEKMKRLRRAVARYGEPVVSVDAIGVAVTSVGTEIRWLRRIG
jgi:putative endonuclease